MLKNNILVVSETKLIFSLLKQRIFDVKSERTRNIQLFDDLEKLVPVYHAFSHRNGYSFRLAFHSLPGKIFYSQCVDLVSNQPHSKHPGIGTFDHRVPYVILTAGKFALKIAEQVIQIPDRTAHSCTGMILVAAGYLIF